MRAAILIPWAIPTIVSAKMWAWMLNDQFGIINDMLLSLGLIDQKIAWTATPDTAMIAVLIVDVWKTTPFMALLILAGLQMIPRDIYEAAEIDGVHPVKVFFKVTLPLIRPALMVAVIFRMLDALRIFDLIYVLTPNNAAHQDRCRSIARENLFDFDKFAYGSAPRRLLFLIIALFDHRSTSGSARSSLRGRHDDRQDCVRNGGVLRARRRHRRLRGLSVLLRDPDVASKSGTALFQVDYWPKALSLRQLRRRAHHRHLSAQYPQLGASSPRSSSLFSLFLGVTAAYALARVRFRGRAAPAADHSGGVDVPADRGACRPVRADPLRSASTTRRWALIFSYMIFTLPFTVWVLTTFMRDLPVEIEEAAIVDGATPWIIITKVFLPLMWPALVTTGLLAFIGAWNEFLFALTFTSSTTTQRTVPVAIALLSGASQYEIPWGTIMAASVIVTVPLVILVLIFQRKIVAGLTAGGVKG